MSKVVGNKFYIAPEAPATCECCGETAELRPYGKDGAKICFKCVMEDIETTNEMFAKTIENIDTVVIIDKEVSDEGYVQ